LDKSYVRWGVGQAGQAGWFLLSELPRWQAMLFQAEGPSGKVQAEVVLEKGKGKSPCLGFSFWLY
jgi:hypothetical protein